MDDEWSANSEYPNCANTSRLRERADSDQHPLSFSSKIIVD